MPLSHWFLLSNPGLTFWIYLVYSPIPTNISGMMKHQLADSKNPSSFSRNWWSKKATQLIYDEAATNQKYQLQTMNGNWVNTRRWLLVKTPNRRLKFMKNNLETPFYNAIEIKSCIDTLFMFENFQSFEKDCWASLTKCWSSLVIGQKS